MKSFGEVLRECRRQARKTLQETADFLGVSAVYVSEVERGKRPPFKNSRLEKLGEFFEIDPFKLIIAAWKQKGLLEVDLANASSAQVAVLSGLARGGLSDECWKEIHSYLIQKYRENFKENCDE